MVTFTPDTDGECSEEQGAAFTLQPPFCMSEGKRIILIYFFLQILLQKGHTTKVTKTAS